MCTRFGDSVSGKGWHRIVCNLTSKSITYVNLTRIVHMCVQPHKSFRSHNNVAEKKHDVIERAERSACRTRRQPYREAYTLFNFFSFIHHVCHQTIRKVVIDAVVTLSTKGDQHFTHSIFVRLGRIEFFQFIRCVINFGP